MLLPLNDNEDHVYDIEQLRIDKVSDRSCVICIVGSFVLFLLLGRLYDCFRLAPCQSLEV